MKPFKKLKLTINFAGMPQIPKKFPKASRPLEYVGLFTMEFPTKEGTAYVYMAADAYSEFAFNTGVEKEESPDNLLKHIYLLTEHPDFVKKMHKGFTLVLNKHEELKDRITAIIGTLKGKVIYNDAFNRKIVYPARKSMEEIRYQR